MRFTNAKLDDVRNFTLTFLRSHLLYTQLGIDLQHAAYQAVLDTDVAANGMNVVMASLPPIVRDQLPKIGSLRVRLDAEGYTAFVKAFGQTIGKKEAKALPAACPFTNYHTDTINFPAGKVFFSATAGALRPPKAGDAALLLGWARLMQAKQRVVAAEQRVVEAGEQMRQLAVESVTLDNFLANVPNARVIIPASWLAPPVEAPKTTLLDPDTSARLRALILGEAA